MWRASFSIPSVTSLSLWKKNCLSAPSTPPLFLLYTDITARTPQKSAHDVSSHFLVGRKKHNTSLAHEYCVPLQYIGFLMVDEIRLLYLTVPLRKVPRRNRTLASSTDVEKLSPKSRHQKFTFPRQVQHNRSSLATPEVTGGFARYPNICGTLYQKPNL